MDPAKTMAPAASPHKQRQRLAVRVGTLLVKHAHVVSMFCYLAGLVVLLLLPALAKNTYVSENALVPGSADAHFGEANARDARVLADEVQRLIAQSTDAPLAIQKWLLSNFEALGVDSYLQSFTPSANPFDAVRFFTNSQKNVSQDYQWQVHRENKEVTRSPAVNVVGIIRAPRGEGNDAIVLVTPVDAQNIAAKDALALGIGLEVLGLLSKALWLAKDIIWLVADSRYGDYAAVAAWLKEYHEPVLPTAPGYRSLVSGVVCQEQPSLNIEAKYGLSPSPIDNSYGCWKSPDDLLLGDFKRAGTIAAGLVVELQQGQEGVTYLQVLGQGLNGQMANLDLVNICNTIATGWGHGCHLILGSSATLLNSAWVRNLGGLLERLSKQLRKWNVDWNYHITGSDYVSGLATFAKSMSDQALGVPTGAHGAFRDYQVDAVTLQFFPGGRMSDATSQIDALQRLGRLLELVVRSVNNLLEKLHHSLFLYVMTSPTKFIAISTYMIPVFLLLVSFPLEAASLWSFAGGDQKSRGECRQKEAGKRVVQDVVGANPSNVSGQSIQPLLVVLIVYAWSALVACLPPFLHALLGHSSFGSIPLVRDFSGDEVRVAAWAFLATLSLWAALLLTPVVSRSSDFTELTSADKEDNSWRILKAFLLAAATIGLAVFSVLNYAIAILGATTLVPMCMTASPLRRTWKKMTTKETSRSAVIILMLRNLLTILSSPLGLVGIGQFLLGLPSSLDIGELWHATEFMWTWSSCLYVYCFMVHLPCTVLSFYILSMPS